MTSGGTGSGGMNKKTEAKKRGEDWWTVLDHVGYLDDAEVPVWGLEFARTDESKIWLHPDAQKKKSANG